MAFSKPGPFTLPAPAQPRSGPLFKDNVFWEGERIVDFDADRKAMVTETGNRIPAEEFAKAMQHTMVKSPDGGTHLRRVGGASVLGAMSGSGPQSSPAKPYDLDKSSTRLQMIEWRLRTGLAAAFREINTTRCNGKIYLMVTTDTGVANLDDDENLFPSDTLVTQLRLLAR